MAYVNIKALVTSFAKATQWLAMSKRMLLIVSPFLAIVAESGGTRLGEWREEVRNVYEDYKRAFGEEPPVTRSVGIMTDTDNTGERTLAYYGDIAFERTPQR